MSSDPLSTYAGFVRPYEELGMASEWDCLRGLYQRDPFEWIVKDLPHPPKCIITIAQLFRICQGCSLRTFGDSYLRFQPTAQSNFQKRGESSARPILDGDRWGIVAYLMCLPNDTVHGFNSKNKIRG
jgi:hypothetical protein